MNFRDKFLLQVVSTLTIIALFNMAPINNNEKFLELRKQLNNQLNEHYSLEDLKSYSNDIVSVVVNSPQKLKQVVRVANEISYYTYPISENSKKDIVDVRAAAGGKVIYSGIDKDLGPCIRIQHENKISTYGNLHTINVILGERIKKSQIIGSYDSKSMEEFYYQLEDSMV